MIIELRTDTLKSRSQSRVEEAFERRLPERLKLSPLAACWRTEVGELNTLIHAWPYADEAERRDVLEREKALGAWPSEVKEWVVSSRSVLLTPAPFSPPPAPQKLGDLYEIRHYTYASGAIPLVIENWQEILAERLKYSPLVAVWYADDGKKSDWIHIWAYKDVAHRESIRNATAKAGIWPSSVVDRRLKRVPKIVSLTMSNILVVPTRFSPLH
jgi:hypothetical protein